MNKNSIGNINLATMETNNIVRLEKTKLYYEKQILSIIKHIIKTRSQYYKVLSLYNQKPSKCNKKKLEEKQLDYNEDKENLEENSYNYGSYGTEYYKMLLDEWNMNKIMKILKNNNYNELWKEHQKQKEKLLKLGNTNNNDNISLHALEITAIHENMNDIYEQIQIYKELFNDFENEFYKKREIEFNEEKQKNEKVKKQRREQKKKEKQEEKRRQNEAKKRNIFVTQVTLWKKCTKEEQLKTKQISNLLDVGNNIVLKKLLGARLITIKAPLNFASIYKNTYTFIENIKYMHLNIDRKYYNDYEIMRDLIAYLKTDEKFKKHIHTVSYIEMIQIDDVEQYSKEVNSNFNPVKAKNYKSSAMNSVCFKYIDYTLNKKATTFEELFYREQEQGDIDNSCYVNLLVNTYNKAINHRIKDNSRKSESNKKKLLTAQKICDICGITYKESNIGLSIEKSIKFFETYHVGLKAIDNFGNLLYSYEPEKYNLNLHPRTLYVLVYNNHVEKLNCDEKSFQQVISDVKKQHEKLEASSKFPTFKTDKTECKTIFINELNDVVPHVIANTNKKATNIKFIYDGPIQEMMFEMLIKARYIPEIIFKDNTIKGIYFKINQNQYVIQYSNMATDTIHTIDEEEYNAYYKYNNMTNEWLLNENFISKFNEETRNILDAFSVNPLTGYFESLTPIDLIGLDERKAYTANLYVMKFIPVFHVFDKFLDYDQHDIDDYTIYQTKFTDSLESRIFVGASIANIYGIHLKQCDIPFTILKYLRPSNLIESNSTGIIDELYSSTLEEKHKKNIINVLIGKCGKIQNNKNIVKMYLNEDEAKYYANKYNGIVYPISSSTLIDNITYNDDTFIEQLFDNDTLESYAFKKIYLVAIEKICKLEENMLPIKHFIYINQRLKNLQRYRQLKNINVKCYGILTDCLLVNAQDEQKLKKHFILKNEIGGLKIEYGKSIRGNQIDFKNVDVIENDKKSIHTYYLKTEEFFFEDPEAYNNEIREILKKHNFIMIWSWYPGGGKSFASSLIGKNILFVTPHNQLCEELIMKGYKAITLHNLMSLRDDGKNTKRKRFDVSEYDTIVFEEILLHDPYLLSSIQKFIKLHPDKKIIANGDGDQNLPIKFDFNNILSSKSNYLLSCINDMFNTHIILRTSKRLENPEDRKTLENLKEDIFNSEINVMDIFNKHDFKIIENMSELCTHNNISYFKSRSYKINKHVQDNLISVPEDHIIFSHIHNNKSYDLKYYKDQFIICRQPFKRKNAELYTNYMYQILDYFLDISNKRRKKIGLYRAREEAKSNMKYIFKIKSIYSDKIMKITFNQLKYMSLPHCKTCHSSQGLTIKNKYTIFDTNISYVDRRWIYTAVTRCTHLENITIFKHSDHECRILDKCKYKQYFELKIQNYIKQDILACRIKQIKGGDIFYKENKIDDYVNCDWIMEQPNFKCYICGCLFDFEIDDGTVNSNFTIDRINNTMYHSKSNCKLCCLLCNTSKH